MLGRSIRFEVLDGWRGVAALLVAVLHFQAPRYSAPILFVGNSYLFVDFFFVLSGFVIAHSYAGRIDTRSGAFVFAVRRFGRVWPLHMAALSFLAGLEFLKLVVTAAGVHQSKFAAFAAGSSTPLWELPAHVTLTHALGFLSRRLDWNFPSWSISAELWTYIIFAAIAVLVHRRWRLPALTALAAVSATVLITTSDHGMDLTFDQGLPRCIVGFTAGVLTYELAGRFRIVASAAAALEWPMLAAVVAFVTFASMGPASFAAPLVFAGAVYVYSFEAGPVSRVLGWSLFQSLGRWSYSIYMVHVPLITVLRLAQRDLFVLPEGGNPAAHLGPVVYDGVVIPYVIALVALARLTHFYIEEPGRLWFNLRACRIQTSHSRLGEPYRTAAPAAASASA